MEKQGQSALIKVFTTAKALEREAYFNYLNFALKIAAVSGKNLFIRLARDEAQHYDWIDEVHQKFQLNKAISLKTVSGPLLQQLAPSRKDLAAIEKSKAISGDNNILELAMAHEMKTKKYYQDKAAEVKLPKVHELLLTLADYEEGHYQALRAEFNNIQQQGYWFDFPETSMEFKEEE